MAVTYEWDIEEWETDCLGKNDDSDILDHNHSDTLKGFGVQSSPSGLLENRKLKLVLVRDDDRGRSWAYSIVHETTGAMTIPETFTDAIGIEVASVPKRFHKELARWQKLKNQ